MSATETPNSSIDTGETEQADAVEQIESAKMSDKEAEDYAKRAQYGRSGGTIDQTMGGMGGAGASGSGPDIAGQSAPLVGNHSDLPANQR